MGIDVTVSRIYDIRTSLQLVHSPLMQVHGPYRKSLIEAVPLKAMLTDTIPPLS